jgi:hypothetical protein
LGGDFESLMGSYRLQAVVFRSLSGVSSDLKFALISC